MNCDVEVQTYHKKGLNSDRWSARSSNLSELDNASKKKYYLNIRKFIVGSMSDLEQTHTHYEKKYIHELVHFSLKPISLAPNKNFKSFSYLAKLEYKFPFPLKRRVFYELIHICQSHDESESYIISLAVDPKRFEDDTNNMVHGTYTSIEKICYNDSTSNLEWIMCTCSSPGGFIPNWLTKISMNAAIAKDVPSFLNWSDSI